MQAHQVNAVVEEDGVVSIEGIPVRAGQRIQVIVLMPDPSAPTERYPLRGRQPFCFDRPDDPVLDEDWGEGE